MRRVVKKGNTLLVNGPAFVQLLSGEVRLLGTTFNVGEKMVIREGKRIPFEVHKKAEFELKLGENASFEEVSGSTIPTSWKEVSKKVLSEMKDVSTLTVMGGIDSGKTSFCTYIINKALKKGRKVAIIDADLGQSDIGPPATIGISCVKAPVRDLFEVGTENTFFVGLTSPSKAVDKVIEGIVKLKSYASKLGVDFLVINTDGWVEGEEAVQYKVRLVEETRPDVVVGIQRSGELAPILNRLNNVAILTVDAPLAIHRRSREKRKILRELSYKKYLKGAKVRSFVLGWINIKGSCIGSGVPMSIKRVEKVKEILNLTPLYCKETSNKIFLVLKRGDKIQEEQIKKLEEEFGKKVKTIREEDYEGLISALYDEKDRFLGIGILEGIDYRRGIIKIYTPVSKKVATVSIGQIKLDRNCREIGVSSALTEN